MPLVPLWCPFSNPIEDTLTCRSLLLEKTEGNEVSKILRSRALGDLEAFLVLGVGDPSVRLEVADRLSLACAQIELPEPIVSQPVAPDRDRKLPVHLAKDGRWQPGLLARRLLDAGKLFSYLEELADDAVEEVWEGS